MAARHIMLIVLGGLLIGACETQRVEYRRRSLLDRHYGTQTSDTRTLSDGTEIRYVDGPTESRRLIGNEQVIGTQRVRIRTDKEDGSVQLNQVLPMHVVSNLHECLSRSEYRVIYEQIISASQRSWYEAQGDSGYESFLQYFQFNREELAKTLNRMRAGAVFGDSVVELYADGGRVSLRSHVAGDFRFTAVELVREGDQLKLQDIVK